MSLLAPFAVDLLAGQVWVVTGGGTGIGRATATLCASLGARVVVAGRRLEPLEQTVAALGACSSAVTCDIREPLQVEALVEATLARHGRIDVLVNNAGGQFPSPAQALSTKGFAAVVNNNLCGTFNVTQAVALKAFLPERRGAIVNVIANVARGFPGMAHTGAARAGVDNLTKTLAVEWATYGVRVNAVAPGIIETPALEQYPSGIIELCRRATPMKRLGTPHEVACAVVFLGSAAASYVSGHTLYVDGAASLWGDVWPIPD